MKKIYTFFALLLLCVATAVAQTTTTWESKSGWTQASGGKAGCKWFGATTPGTADTQFTLSEFKIMHEIDASKDRYIAIATANSTSTLNEADVVAISNNHVAPSAVQLYTYTFDSDVTLNGGTTYYIVFLSSNTPSNGAYTVSDGRVALNHTSYGNYTPGFVDGNGTSRPAWWPYYTAELTTSVTLVNVTYELYESDGTTLVTSVVNQQAANSDPSIPASLTAGAWYFPIYYNYTIADGEIGTTDCTVKVVRTAKPEVVTNTANLSNTKAYSIQCKRGYLSTYNGQIASTNYSQATLTGKNFAIISYENAYYLYSVEDAMFVQQDGMLDTYPNGSTVSFSATTSPLYQIKFGTNFLNVNDQNYGWVINTWSTPDDGNQFVIIEAGDFDPTNALEKFADRTPYYEALNAAITAAGNVPFGTTLHTYVKSADFDNALATAQSTYANGDATIEELTAATQALTTAIDACTLNMPTEGFYRIKGKTSGKYLAGTKTDVNSKFNMSDAVDATTIFYYSGTKLISYSTGMENGMTGNVWAWNYDGEGATVVFQDGLTLGGYAIQSGGNGNFYDLGTSADRGRDVTIDASTNARYTSWYLEPVTELPITLRRTSDDTPYFATFSAPVAVRIEGATLNNVTPEANSISYKAVDTNQLPANTGVLLTGTSASATAYVVTDEVADAGYGLQAYDAAFTVAEEDQTSKLFLGKGKDSDKVGFYKLGSASTNGFKAYFANSTGEAKEGFDLVDANETTGVESIDNSQFAIDNAPVYNLQGQRVNKAQKGVFIQNGKKVVVK